MKTIILKDGSRLQVKGSIEFHYEYQADYTHETFLIFIDDSNKDCSINLEEVDSIE